MKDFFLSQNVNEAQIKLLMNSQQKWVKGYSKEDVIKGLVLKTMPSKAFEYVRKQKLIALPSRHQQQQWLKVFNCQPVFQSDSLQVNRMKMVGPLSPLEKLGVICFDEMAVRKRYEMDNHDKKIYGPVSKLQMAVDCVILGSRVFITTLTAT